MWKIFGLMNFESWVQLSVFAGCSKQPIGEAQRAEGRGACFLVRRGHERCESSANGRDQYR